MHGKEELLKSYECLKVWREKKILLRMEEGSNTIKMDKSQITKSRKGLTN